MKRSTALLIALVPGVALAAASGDGHGMDEKTLKTIIYQCINVGILLIALVYFLKDTVRQHFKDKQQAYLNAAEKAQAVRRQAEEQHAEIKAQLTKLETTADESISRARAEAADLKKQIVAEAQALSKRIKEEAETAARIEVDRARAQLRGQMIQQAAQMTEKHIKEKVSREELQKLQGDFIRNIEAVQS